MPTPVEVLAEIDHWPTGIAAGILSLDRTIVASHGPTTQPLPIASITKPLFSYALLIAVEEGTLALNQPVGPPESTVAHLLAHASGLGPDVAEPMSAPGTRRIYSNAGFETLGQALAEAASMDAATYLHEAVLAPLGMGASTLDGSPAHAGVSCAADLAAFGRELLSPTLVSKETLNQATTPFLPELTGVLPGFGRQDPNPWGLGFEIRGSKDPHWTGAAASPETFGHFGRAGGFLWVDPTRNATAVVLTDTDFGPWAAEAWPGFNDRLFDAVDQLGRP